MRTSDGKAHVSYDWTDALQRAIDSGATTIYFPNRAIDQAHVAAASPDADEPVADEAGEDAEAADDEFPDDADSEAGADEPEATPATKLSKKERRALAQQQTPGTAPTEPTAPVEQTQPKRVMIDGQSVKVRSGDSYGIYGTVYLRNKVRRIIGCESSLDGIVSSTENLTDFQPELVPVFVLEDGEAPAVIVERFNTWYTNPSFVQKSKRTLVISSLSFYEVATEPGAGDVFLHDVRIKHIAAIGSNIWARQVNPEGHHEPRVTVDGGSFWVLGLKTENDATIGIVRNGGKAEILGGFFYANKGKISPKMLWVNEDSDLSFTYGSWKTKRGKPFDVIVRETRDGVTREIRHEDALPRGEASALALYTGSSPKGTVAPAKPTDVAAKADGTAAVSVSWQGSIANADGVAIEMRNAKGEFDLARVVAPDRTTATIGKLKAGTAYIFRVRSFSGAGSALSDSVGVTSEAAAPVGSGTGLQGTYFSDPGFQTPATERVDPSIDFEWKGSAPAEGLKPDRYSVRWTGTIEPRFTETHTFMVDASAGARLFVDDEMLIDTITEYDRHIQSGTIDLAAGKPARIRLEFANTGASGAIKLSWKSQNTPAEVVPATQLHPGAPDLPKVSLSPGSVELRENAGKAMLTVKREGGDPAQPLTMALQTTGDAVPGVHFTLPAAPVVIPVGETSAELAVDIIDNQQGEPDRKLSIALAPDAGHLPSGFRSTIEISDDDMPPPGDGSGWKAQYFQGADFEKLIGGKVHAKSDMGWDKKPPFPGVDPAEPYTVRWEAELDPLFSEKYKLTVTVGGKGGARLWVNGELVVDLWDTKGVNSAFLELQAGKRVPIKVEMKQEKFYGAQLGVLWSSASQYLQPIPASQLHPHP